MSNYRTAILVRNDDESGNYINVAADIFQITTADPYLDLYALEITINDKKYGNSIRIHPAILTVDVSYSIHYKCRKFEPKSEIKWRQTPLSLTYGPVTGSVVIPKGRITFHPERANINPILRYVKWEMKGLFDKIHLGGVMGETCSFALEVSVPKDEKPEFIIDVTGNWYQNNFFWSSFVGSDTVPLTIKVQ